MIVQSRGELQALNPSSPFRFAYAGADRGGFSHVDDAVEGYADVYAAQPNIRIPIDFLAGNVAQLGIHVFRRVSDTDRVRLADHELARWLKKPNPATTQYRLIEALLGDLGVYLQAYWLKVRYKDETGAKALGLLRLPPERVEVKGGLLPSEFVWTSSDGGKKVPFAPSEIVAFGGYNPCNPLVGLSKLATLYRIIREDDAASAHREYYWRNASRHEGVIERPKEAPRWTPQQKQAFREQWQARFAGAGNAGLVAVLEDGMAFKPTAFSPRDSEFILGGKLRREVTAAGFNVPQPSIGILDHATYANIREQHKQLYQDSLGPALEMISQEFERQLLPECEDQDNVYIEFNIAAKLAGSFEEQSNAIRLLVGRPIMTPNEGRARLNLPAIKDDPSADQIAPQQGGPSDASAQPSEPPPPTDEPIDGDVIDEPTDALVALTVQATRVRQQASLAKHPAPERSSAFFAQMDRWNRELTDDLIPLLGEAEATRVAVSHNARLFTDLELEES